MTTQYNYTTIAAWSLAISKALKAAGVEPEPLLASVGLALGQLTESPEDRIPIEHMTRLWEVAENATNNPAFGLDVAKQVTPMHFRSLGLLFISCNTLAQAFQKLADYYTLVSDSGLIRLDRRPDQIGFIIEPLKGVEVSPLAIDAFFATVLQLSNQFVAQSGLVVSVSLKRSKPKPSKPWANFFNCPVQFEHEVNCLWLHRGLLENTSILGDPQSAAQNEAVVRNYLTAMNALSWSERVKRAIHSVLLSGESNLSTVASVFNLSDRTLSRYLKEEGTSFRQLLQEKQNELAHYYLIKTALPVNEIAHKLGFSDTSNFNRAFLRWNQCRPLEYRSRQQ
ncbi:AraC family transcriptional regulator [Litoribacillus peritrichatus]|uniref:AraC family transcriptional regulator n=1 Tax=Litoribacillus peritrichatus TaxID=718191 RepID=A0ABP7MDD0_9GAMM